MKLIRIEDVSSTRNKPGLLPVSKATIVRWAADGCFPAPIRLSDKITCFDREKVEAWIQEQVAKSEAGA